MRVSSNIIYQQSVFNLGNRQSDLTTLQNQLSTGRRILSPSDDPVASARSLNLQQSTIQNEQYINNVQYGRGALSLAEGNLRQVTSTIQEIQKLAVQSGSPALTSAEKKMIEADIRGKYQELIGLANSTDGNGLYLFSGYKGDTKPFNELAYGNVRYDGDQGQRNLQISTSRQISVSDAGSEIFIKINDGNGTFTTSMMGNAGGTNLGTGVISPGVVTDPVKWTNTNNNERYRIQFHVVPDPVDASKNITSYDIIDNDTTSANYNRSLIDGYNYTTSTPAGGRTDTVANPNAFPRRYTSGSDILFSQQTGEATPLYANWDFGGKLNVEGVPKDGDSFKLEPSKYQDLFTTIGDFATALTSYANNSVSGAVFQNQLNTLLSNMDNSLNQVLTVQANIGARMNEVDAVETTSTDLNVQFKTTISKLTDLDYVSAISDFSLTQTYLEAARKSFSSVQGLSLFQYIS
ncbi:flagellar hook-associated protein FlgL [Chitinimonas sp. BJB300]|uniref:flagellar hook-associated protein FlgL n=1 Tax=Chitinimonas sp. BJB300 TaxID=1559339 RepID=UPI000C0F8D4F|nr:flagellar hook-associated protein FlgL [Chitinimonas sp. BJB300]PHV11243.1 flagellar hook-associated protein 3 [Chitinimonas sp. BJB300]TSJ88611.1 flagellar hook-associated protein 3 [Chitinimonas sp. BJB300]